MKKDTKIIIGVVIIAPIIAVIGVMSTYSTNVPERETNYRELVEYSGVEFDIENMKKGYMIECMITPELEDYCECNWDYMIDREGISGMIEIGLKMMEEKSYIPPLMWDAMDYCIK